jgi:small nuclear ribonucleoprotein (snRNP)-like protein
MTSDILERILLCPRTAFLADEIVDLQRVQCVSMSNGVSFEITLVSGVVVKGQHVQFSNFMNKYMSYVESKC